MFMKGIFSYALHFWNISVKTQIKKKQQKQDGNCKKRFLFEKGNTMYIYYTIS